MVTREELHQIVDWLPDDRLEAGRTGHSWIF